MSMMWYKQLLEGELRVYVRLKFSTQSCEGTPLANRILNTNTVVMKEVIIIYVPFSSF